MKYLLIALLFPLISEGQIPKTFKGTAKIYYRDDLVGHMVLPKEWDAQYDTVKVKMLVENQSAEYKETVFVVVKYGWRVIQLHSRQEPLIFSDHGPKDDILLFEDKKTRVPNDKVWQHKPFNW